MKSAERQVSPSALPVAQRLAAKLSASARALMMLAQERGISSDGQAMVERLHSLARVAEGMGADPLDRLAAAWSLSRIDLLRLLVIGLPDVDPEAAEIVAKIEGQGECRLSIRSAASIADDGTDPLWDHRLVSHHPLVTSGLLLIEGEGSLGKRRLRLADGVWPGLLGQMMWPNDLAPLPFQAMTQCGEAGTDEARAALAALADGLPAVIAILGENAGQAANKAAALCTLADKRFVMFRQSQSQSGRLRNILGHALLRGCCPILVIDPPTDGVREHLSLPGPDFYPAPVVIVSSDLTRLEFPDRPLIAPPLLPAVLEDIAVLWKKLNPDLSEEALGALAARYPVEPSDVLTISQDAAARARIAGRQLQLDDLKASLNARGTAKGVSSGERRVPIAGWEALVLPAANLAELKSAVRRAGDRTVVSSMLPVSQMPVGQRLLFTGPPGTGKTLAAEVMAREMGAGLLVADTPRLLSKWLGETERNLANLFQSAEESHAVLFFDEADAIFGKRTETKDARDRYANIETAFLLQRIERFRSLVILATNLPGNLDDAFRRRFDAIIDFPNPDAACRERLWQLHLPRQVVDERIVDIASLADWYTMPGGWIRNAAVAAAYLAVSDNAVLQQHHVIQAIAREYLKGGRPFPGPPANMTHQIIMEDSDA